MAILRRFLKLFFFFIKIFGLTDFLHCSNLRLLYSGYRKLEILLAFRTFDLRLNMSVILGFNAFYR